MADRTNLVTNPSFETNVTGWSTATGTLAQSTDQASVGTNSAKLTNATGATATIRCDRTTGTRFTGITQNTNYVLSFRVFAPGTRTVSYYIAWYTSADVWISNSTTPSDTAVANAWGYHTLYVQSPANAAKAEVKIGISLLNNTSAYVDAILLEAWTVPAGTALIANSGFETDTTGWTSYNATIESSTDVARTGSRSLKVTGSGTGTIYGKHGSLWVSQGDIVLVRGYGRSGAATGTGYGLMIDWYTATDTYLKTSNTGSTSVNNTSWTLRTGTFVAPPGATYGVLWAYAGGGVGVVAYWDDVEVLNQGQPAYFDGATADTDSYRYDWTGTAHASTSTVTYVNNGSATGALALDPGGITGITTRSGSSTGTVTLAGSAIGLLGSGSGTGQLVFAGSATGVKPPDPIFRFECPTYRKLISPPPMVYRPKVPSIQSVSVVRVNGTFTDVKSPSYDLLKAAGVEGEDYFLGGRIYDQVTAPVALELIAAGYTPTEI